MLCTCVNGSISQITNFGLQKADLYIFLSFVKPHRGHTGISGGGGGYSSKKKNLQVFISVHFICNCYFFFFEIFIVHVHTSTPVQLDHNG